MNFQPLYEQAKKLDQEDTLKSFRDEFVIPSQFPIYLTGNSLGLMPKSARKAIDESLEDWERLGVEGHLHARHPWLPYHEFVTDGLAHIIGAKPSEVVAMGTLTANLHFLFISFYRPTQKRFKILIEGSTFPSDQYAVDSQAEFHASTIGFNPKDAVVEIFPRSGETWIRTEDIERKIKELGDELALVWFGGVNYLSGQAFDFKAITKAAHDVGAYAGFDLAHAAGNLLLDLHGWNVDCAAWCSYKYLNSGPGAIAGIYVHEKHHRDQSIPKFKGWWGHDKGRRFKMERDFIPIPTVESWQHSNPPILQLAALRASVDIFKRATMPALRAKSVKLTAFLESCLKQCAIPGLTITTPSDPSARGAQLSLKIDRAPKEKLENLLKVGVVCDFREPDILRAAPTPLYNRFEDCVQFVEKLHSTLGGTPT